SPFFTADLFATVLTAAFLTAGFLATVFFAAAFLTGTFFPEVFLTEVFFVVAIAMVVDFSNFTSFGSLSFLSPINIGWRAILLPVHSVNLISHTSSGF